MQAIQLNDKYPDPVLQLRAQDIDPRLVLKAAADPLVRIAIPPRRRRTDHLPDIPSR